MGSLDYGRDTSDAIIRGVGNAWWEEARKMTGELLPRTITRIAKAEDTDPDYLLWTVVGHPKSWVRKPGVEMLQVARRLYLESANRSRAPLSPNIPETWVELERGETALKELIQWSRGPYIDKLVEPFVSLLKSEGEKIKVAMWEDHQERYTTSQARKRIVRDLPLRVRDHPHWFRDPGTLQLLVKGVLG